MSCLLILADMAGLASAARPSYKPLQPVAADGNDGSGKALHGTTSGSSAHSRRIPGWVLVSHCRGYVTGPDWSKAAPSLFWPVLLDQLLFTCAHKAAMYCGSLQRARSLVVMLQGLCLRAGIERGSCGQSLGAGATTGCCPRSAARRSPARASALGTASFWSCCRTRALSRSCHTRQASDVE